MSQANTHIGYRVLGLIILVFGFGGFGLLHCTSVEPQSGLLFPYSSAISLQTPSNGSEFEVIPVAGVAFFRWTHPNEFTQDSPYWVLAMSEFPLFSSLEGTSLGNPDAVKWMWTPSLQGIPMSSSSPSEVEFQSLKKVANYSGGSYSFESTPGTLQSGVDYYWATWLLDIDGSVVYSSPVWRFQIASQ